MLFLILLILYLVSSTFFLYPISNYTKQFHTFIPIHIFYLVSILKCSWTIVPVVNSSSLNAEARLSSFAYFEFVKTKKTNTRTLKLLKSDKSDCDGRKCTHMVGGISRDPCDSYQQRDCKQTPGYLPDNVKCVQTPCCGSDEAIHDVVWINHSQNKNVGEQANQLYPKEWVDSFNGLAEFIVCLSDFFNGNFWHFWKKYK